MREEYNNSNSTYTYNNKLYPISKKNLFSYMYTLSSGISEITAIITSHYLSAENSFDLETILISAII